MSAAASWAERIAAGDRRAIARAISAVENENADAPAVRAALAGRTGHARILGVTGPPAAGKSTLVNALIGAFRASGKTVAVLAVDPSSPVSGGALLGDRLRMLDHQEDERVFIRSLAARGHLGGLTRTTRAVLDVLDAARFDVVIIETVGAGQSEVEIAGVAETKLVICPPDLGDEVQAIKAGVLEVADIFVVNKSDMPLAARAEQQLLAMLEIRKRSAWIPPVVRTVATTGEGVPALIAEIERHQVSIGARAKREAPRVDFRVRRKVARIHDPRRKFELADIESEVREDPLTGETSRICHFAFPPRQVPDLAAMVEATRASCPFCPEKVETVTPRYPEALLRGGRSARGEALLFPNLFPYDDVSAIVSMQREHFAPMDALRPAMIADALILARDFIREARAAVTGDAFGIVTWNYMPPSGASQVHPHMQVIVTDTPGNALRRELAAEARFLERHGVSWPSLLLQTERAGERFIVEEGPVTWWAPFCPVGMLGDVQAVFAERATLGECSDADLDVFARTLARLAAAYARLGLWSFNLTLFPQAEGRNDGTHWLGARLLPRFYLNPALHNSDVAYL
ncbi:MAG TPA: methylmalonyl Co-A mutase-associated GTPase MeaB, partial [Burkholderiales bacterium]